MSDNQRLRTRRQVLSAMVKKLVRNPTKPSPEKLHHSGVVDLCESSQPSSSRSHGSLSSSLGHNRRQGSKCLMMIDIQKGGDCRGVKITKVFNQNNAEQVGVFGGSHSKKENDVANEDLSIVRIYIKSRDSRSRVEDLRLFQEDQIIY
ncbi:hypothetical protein F2Q68_00039448 [Brassica cretica]|uniref:Uncharacterized protein n=1 Tax=Brassica cretica TaxID=69181 RepID=A0A8S9MMP6_BRACR|nr:hypothetical protein F2Q68_00039448 [Brassica cretica]